jgi:hypothetical protein
MLLSRACTQQPPVRQVNRGKQTSQGEGGRRGRKGTRIPHRTMPLIRAAYLVPYAAETLRRAGYRTGGCKPRAKRPKPTTRKVSGAPSKAAKRRGGKGSAKPRGSMALLPVNEAMRRLTAGRRLEYLFSRPADHDHRGTQEFWLSGKIEGPCRKAKKSQGDVTGGRLCIVTATSAVHCAPKLLRVRGGRYGGTCILLMTPSWWSIVLKQTMAWRGA